MLVPSALGRQLYVKGSLRNTPRGFQWTMRNTLASGALLGLGPLEVDGKIYPPGRVTLRLLGTTIKAAEIKAPLEFPEGAEVTIEVEGEPLVEGEHEILLRLHIQGLGEIGVSIRDEI